LCEKKKSSLFLVIIQKSSTKNNFNFRQNMIRYLVPKRLQEEENNDDDAGGDDAGEDAVVDGLRRPKKRTKNLSSSSSTLTHHQRTAIIYAYGYKKDDSTQHAYVGQSYQLLSKRDWQHMNGTVTKFDKLHTANGTSPFLPPIVLETKMFEATGTDSIDVEAQVLAECCAWMDKKEMYYISKFNTYSSAQGLNQTKGGQGIGKNKAYFQAKLKKQLLEWQKILVPALLNSKWGKEGEIFKIPQNAPKIGRLLHTIRNGDRVVPQSIIPKLNAAGFMDGRPRFDCMFEAVYMPDMRNSEYGKKNKLWAVTPKNDKNIGMLLDSIRTNNTAIPHPKYLEEMNEMGWMNGLPFVDCKWQVDILPLCRKFVQENINNNSTLDNINQRFMMKGSAVKIGHVIYILKRRAPKSLAQLSAKTIAEIRRLGITV
jgi:hypothetical protein